MIDPNNSIFSLTVALIASNPGFNNFLGSNPFPSLSFPAFTFEISFSPIYDCGSCLNPMLDDKDILVLDENEVKNLAINSYSCIKVDNKKIEISFDNNNDLDRILDIMNIKFD